MVSIRSSKSIAPRFEDAARAPIGYCGEREIAEFFLNNLDLADIVVSRAPHRGDTNDTKLPASDIATIPKERKVARVRKVQSG
jgi:hypothetical protein